MRLNGFKLFLYILYGISLLAILFVLYTNRDYYLAPSTVQVQMDNHLTLKPAGFFGHGVGIIGTLFMLVLLLYSVRKRYNIFDRLGPLSHWLDIHIFFGIIGPVLVTVHTAFKFNGIVAVSFWSMIAVALSGFIGRYIYIQIPRNIAGHELTRKDMERLNEDYNRELKEHFNFTDEMVTELDNIAHVPKKQTDRALSAIFSMIQDDITGTFKLRNLRNEYVQQFHFPAQKVKEVMKVARKKAKLERRIDMLGAMQQIFHYWHIIHKPFAIIMYLIMVIHVAVAIVFGYTWIL